MRLLFSSVSAKEYAEREQSQTQRILQAKVIRKDFPIEVLSVPYNHVPLSFVKGASNLEVLQAVQEDVRKTIPQAIVIRIAWIYG